MGHSQNLARWRRINRSAGISGYYNLATCLSDQPTEFAHRDKALTDSSVLVSQFEFAVGTRHDDHRGVARPSTYLGELSGDWQLGMRRYLSVTENEKPRFEPGLSHSIEAIKDCEVRDS
jgi:hypothetical protein